MQFKGCYIVRLSTAVLWVSALQACNLAGSFSGEFNADERIEVEFEGDSVAAIQEDQSLQIQIRSNIDLNGVNFQFVENPKNGIANFGVGGKISYQPHLNFNGSDSFTYKAFGAELKETIGKIDITVSPVNDAPVFEAKSVDLNEDTVFDFSWNALDVDNDSLTMIILESPTRGVLSGNLGQLRYLPNLNQTGTDTALIQVSDGKESRTARLALNIAPVNDAPIALAQSVPVVEDTSKNFTVTATDLESASLSFSVVQAPTKGNITGTSPNFTYVPNLNTNGMDSIRFRVSDGALNSEAVVTFNVSAVNDAPSMLNALVGASLGGGEKSIGLSAVDVDSPSLTYSIVQNPSKGVLVGTAPNLTYRQNAGVTGQDTFVFRVSDGSLSVDSTVLLSLTPINVAPVASAQSLSTNEDLVLNLNLLATDADLNPLSTQITMQPLHGSLAVLSGTSLRYTPAANYNGSDSFKYKVSDGALLSNEATVSITVLPQNDVPIAESQNLVLNEDTSLAITLRGTDVDANNLSFSIVRNPSKGMIVSIAGSPHLVSYTPSANMTGSDSFDFQVSDGTLAATATVSLNISAVNDSPRAVPLTVAVTEDTMQAFVLSGSDVDSAVLTYSIVQAPTKGSLSGTAPNLNYLPNLNTNGTDSLTFRVSDGILSSESIVTFNVAPVNDAPTTLAQSVSTALNTAVNITLSGADVDSSTLSPVITTQPLKGTLAVVSGLMVRYTPTTGSSGADSFKYKISDGALMSAEATLAISVNAANCVGSATQMCMAGNGSGSQTRICTNSVWGDYGTCMLSSCNSGYSLANGACVPNSGAGTLAATIDCSTITQHGITWNFDSTKCGKYANGDNFVLGPITLRSILPNDTNTGDGVDMHGSMIAPEKPEGYAAQAFDSRSGSEVTYTQSLNIARSPNGRVIPENRTIISSLSHVDTRTARNQIRVHAVLTVVNTIPEEGCFRPGVLGYDKTCYWKKSQIKFENLKKTVPANLISVSEAAGKFEKPVVNLGYNTSYKHEYIIGTESTAFGAAGPEFSLGSAFGSLALSANSTESKELLAIRYIQLGLDIYNNVKLGDIYYPFAAAVYGHKLPVLTAGYLLGDATILNKVDPRKNPAVFAEDITHFYVTQNDIDTPRMNSGGKGKVGCANYNSPCDRPLDPYVQSMLGMPEWGIEGQKTNASANWGTIYRNYGPINLIGVALGAHAMGIEQQWGNPAFFDYVNMRAWPLYSPVFDSSKSPAVPLLNPTTRNIWIALRSASGAVPAGYTGSLPPGSVWKP